MIQELYNKWKHHSSLRLTLDQILTKLPWPNEDKQIFTCFLLVTLRYLVRSENDSTVRYQSPASVRKIFEDLGIPLDLSQKIDDQVSYYQLAQMIIEKSVNTRSPGFLSRQYGKTDFIALVGDWLAASLNTSICVYDVAPLFALMEQEVVFHMQSKLGFVHADGMFVSGGSLANAYAIHLARFYYLTKHPHAKELVLLVSEQAHYSYRKMAMFLGLSSEGIYKIPCFEDGSMNCTELESVIQTLKSQNKHPFMIGATSGTTIFGAFDDLTKLSVIKQKYQLWLHSDASWGGICLWSDTHRNLMQDSAKLDSCCFNLHKFMGASLQCSLFVTSHQNLLYDCNADTEPYLFQKELMHSELDTGKKMVQCGRRNDALKSWLMLRLRKPEYFTQSLQTKVMIVQKLAQELEADKNFRLVRQPNFVNLCFIVIPDNLQNKDPLEYIEVFDQICIMLKSQLRKNGKYLLSHAKTKPFPNFFRLCLTAQSPDKIGFYKDMLRDMKRAVNQLDLTAILK